MKPMPKVACPTCKKRGDWFAGKYGPFCSNRCKLVDLGKWLKEEHKVSEPLQPDEIGDQRPEDRDQRAEVGGQNGMDGPSALHSEED